MNTASMKYARWRGVIVELIRRNHLQQESRLEYVYLCDMLRTIVGNDVGLNDVLTMLQDLKTSGYVDYKVERDEWNRQRLAIKEIELTSRGVQLAEGHIKDPAVKILL